MNENPVLSKVVLILFFKVLATALSFGSGTVGGVLTPTLTLGACLGWIFSQLNEGCLDQSIAYAALGMGAMLSGTTLAPLMATLMLFEMTLDAALFFPLVVANFVARTLASAIHPVSVYGAHPETLAQDRPGQLLVSGFSAQTGCCVREEDTLGSIFERVWFWGSDRVWVIDREGRYLGYLLLKQILITRRTSVRWQHLARDLMHKGPVIHPSTPLIMALRKMQSHKTRRLPVIDQDQTLRSELTYSETILALKTD